MRYYKKIVAFRREYLKLNYFQTDQNLTDLFGWNTSWCIANDIPEDLHATFFELARTYSEKEWMERFLYEELRKNGKKY